MAFDDLSIAYREVFHAPFLPSENYAATDLCLDEPLASLEGLDVVDGRNQPLRSNSQNVFNKLSRPGLGVAVAPDSTLNLSEPKRSYITTVRRIGSTLLLRYGPTILHQAVVHLLLPFWNMPSTAFPHRTRASRWRDAKAAAKLRLRAAWTSLRQIPSSVWIGNIFVFLLHREVSLKVIPAIRGRAAAMIQGRFDTVTSPRERFGVQILDWTVHKACAWALSAIISLVVLVAEESARLTPEIAVRQQVGTGPAHRSTTGFDPGAEQAIIPVDAFQLQKEDAQFRQCDTRVAGDLPMPVPCLGWRDPELIHRMRPLLALSCLAKFCDDVHAETLHAAQDRRRCTNDNHALLIAFSFWHAALSDYLRVLRHSGLSEWARAIEPVRITPLGEVVGSEAEVDYHPPDMSGLQMTLDLQNATMRASSSANPSLHRHDHERPHQAWCPMILVLSARARKALLRSAGESLATCVPLAPAGLPPRTVRLWPQRQPLGEGRGIANWCQARLLLKPEDMRALLLLLSLSSSKLAMLYMIDP